ncbi:hypothetical protein ACQ4PT_056634 [Festuca glaucescens]
MDSRYIFETVKLCLPEPPFPVGPCYRYDSRGFIRQAVAAYDGSHHRTLSSTFPSDGDEDHISALPDDLRLKILSRLPLTDAGRTSAVSKCWRGLWKRNPLIFRGDQLTTKAIRIGFDDGPLVEEISNFLESYEGPFGWLHLFFDYIKHEGAVANWIRLFAEKDLKTLILIHEWQYPFVIPRLPISIISCSTLRRLYLGLWKFPDTTCLARSPDVFPCLEELGICHTILQDHDLKYLLACSPQLKSLNFIQSYNSPSRVHICSPDLSRIVLWFSTVEELALAGLKYVRPEATIPSVKVLALKLPSSQDNDEANEELSPVFWQNVARVECIESHLTKVVLDQATVVGNEFGFIKMLFRKAEMLQEMVLVLPWRIVLKDHKQREATDKMAEQRANGMFARFELRMLESLGPESSWSYASDISARDPFPPSVGHTVFWSPGGVASRNLRWLRD